MGASPYSAGDALQSVTSDRARSPRASRACMYGMPRNATTGSRTTPAPAAALTIAAENRTRHAAATSSANGARYVTSIADMYMHARHCSASAAPKSAPVFQAGAASRRSSVRTAGGTNIVQFNSRWL